jgi:hypothetical protein
MVLIINIVFRDVITCTLVSSYQCFGAKNCLHIQGISSSVLNMEAVGTFKTLITTWLTTCCHDPEDSNVQDDMIPEKCVFANCA